MKAGRGRRLAVAAAVDGDICQLIIGRFPFGGLRSLPDATGWKFKCREKDERPAPPAPSRALIIVNLFIANPKLIRASYTSTPLSWNQKANRSAVFNRRNLISYQLNLISIFLLLRLTSTFYTLRLAPLFRLGGN